MPDTGYCRGFDVSAKSHTLSYPYHHDLADVDLCFPVHMSYGKAITWSSENKTHSKPTHILSEVSYTITGTGVSFRPCPGMESPLLTSLSSGKYDSANSRF